MQVALDLKFGTGGLILALQMTNRDSSRTGQLTKFSLRQRCVCQCGNEACSAERTHGTVGNMVSTTHVGLAAAAVCGSVVLWRYLSRKVAEDDYEELKGEGGRRNACVL